MKKDLNIKIDEITRVEGHGNVVIDVKSGEIKELELQIIESPRFFEVMLKGRRFDEAQHIMSRICGICAVSHTSASVRAIEAAMGMKISRQARLLRKLAFCGENIQSHVLHLYFLVLPDLLDEDSIVPILKSHPGHAKTGLELKRLANDVCELVCGRHIHPISIFPGGVAHAPSPEDLRAVRARLVESFEGLEETLEMLAELPFPEFDRPREYIGLKGRGEYAVYEGTPRSSLGYSIPPEEYSRKISEYVVDYSAAKHAESPRGIFMVGAAARVNNNFRQLGPRAKDAAKRLGLKPPITNPFHNNTAQLVECFQFTEDAVRLIDELLELGPRAEPLKKGKGPGRGAGIVEAPRGTLYHEYAINADGVIEEAECVIPTNQNLKSIEEDLRAFVPTILDRPHPEITHLVESLVRAYDPCISCSTHFMEVNFV